MKKHNKTNDLKAAVPNNPVAKFAHYFNRAQTHADKSKYQRHAKHKGSEPFPIGLSA